jgi:hypothetical protein
MRKQHLIYLLLIALFSSCISAKRYNTIYVEPKFEENEAVILQKSENFTVDIAGLKDFKRTTISTKLKSQLIPAILYWQWDRRLQAEVNPQIVGNIFKKNFISLADSLKLEDKLQGHKLELKIEQVPNTFQYIHSGNTAIFLFFYILNDVYEVVPQEVDLMVSYKLSKNGELVKSGTLSAINIDKPVQNNWKSPKKLTWIYIDQFKYHTFELSREIFKQLLGKI